jgi:hypothetical protein
MARSMFTNEMESFISHITNGTKSIADISNVITSQAVLDGFYKSAECGCEVEIKIKE